MQPILTANLTTRQTYAWTIPHDWEQDYLGGAGLAARLLYSRLTADLDPLSPQAPLLFLTGPLTGTAGPAVGRFVVCGKSPATGLWAESNCGGSWGPALRFSGFDGLLVEGKASGPVYIYINNGVVEIRDASAAWGADTYASQEIIKQEIRLPGTHVLTIGPAGENGVLFAGLFCDHGRTAGRTGLGAAAGAKNLKAIAVRGNQKLPLAQADEYHRLRKLANLALREDNFAEAMRALGTAGAADYSDYLGAMPKKYYRLGCMPDVDHVTGTTMAETILTGTSTCHACAISCGRVVTLPDGVKRKGPEYETIVGFGPNLMNADLEEIVHLNELCDRLGMDTISASNTIGLAYHLFEQGVVSEDEIGFPLRWGDTHPVHKLLRLTAARQGIGETLAKGARALGKHFGAEEAAVQVNGLEVPYHDPRGVSGMALVYATSPRGACHNKSDYFFVDWGQADPSLGMDLIDRQAGAEKAANVARHQNWRSACDCLVMCLFSNLAPETIPALVDAACGGGWSIADLLKAGERAWTLKRLINGRLGLTAENDRLFPPALRKPYEDGAANEYAPDLDAMLAAYYEARGWDAVSGMPSPAKIRELGLGWTEIEV